MISSLENLQPKRRVTALVFLWLALALLLAGIGLPLISLEKFYIFENRVSLWSGTWGLLSEGEWFLGGILFCFSILFPLGKNLLLLALLHGVPAARNRIRGVMHALSILGKWSMLDVFIVAILVCSVKLGLLADTQVLAGVYCFATSVLLTNLVSTWLDIRLKPSDRS